MTTPADSISRHPASDIDQTLIPQISPFAGLLRYRRDRMGWFGELGRDQRDIVESRLHSLRLIVITSAPLAHALLVEHADSLRKGPAITRYAPVILGQGLLTSHGDLHKRQRKMLAPKFTPRQIAGYATAMVELTQSMLASWRLHEPHDMTAEMGRLTLAIAAQTMFGAEIANELHVAADALEVANRYVMEEATSLLHLPRSIPTKRHRVLRAKIAALDELVYRLIRDRRARGVETPDVLSALLAARDEDGNGISDELIRDEINTFFLAGHETTATAMSWAYYLIARSPAVARQLAEEVDRVLDGRVPTLDDVERLPVTTQVLQEALRLYPPVYMLGREAIRDIRLGPYTIPRGAYVVVNLYGMHRRGDYFAAPNDMLPERFAAAPTWPRYGFAPFGLGPRVCIGNHFAMMEGVLILAQLAQAIEFRGCEGEIPMEPLVTLRPSSGVPFRPVWRQ